VHLLDRFGDSRRLWLATAHLTPSVLPYLARFGEPIRYKHAPDRWPLAAYQQVFGTEPGSAEMPSASRPFTPELVVDQRGEVLTRAADRHVELARDVVGRGLPAPAQRVHDRAPALGENRGNAVVGHENQSSGRSRWLSPNSCHR